MDMPSLCLVARFPLQVCKNFWVNHALHGEERCSSGPGSWDDNSEYSYKQKKEIWYTLKRKNGRLQVEVGPCNTETQTIMHHILSQRNILGKGFKQDGPRPAA